MENKQTGNWFRRKSKSCTIRCTQKRRNTTEDAAQKVMSWTASQCPRLSISHLFLDIKFDRIRAYVFFLLLSISCNWIGMRFSSNWLDFRAATFENWLSTTNWFDLMPLMKQFHSVKQFKNLMEPIAAIDLAVSIFIFDSSNRRNQSVSCISFAILAWINWCDFTWHCTRYSIALTVQLPSVGVCHSRGSFFLLLLTERIHNMRFLRVSPEWAAIDIETFQQDTFPESNKQICRQWCTNVFKY